MTGMFLWGCRNDFISLKCLHHFIDTSERCLYIAYPRKAILYLPVLERRNLATTKIQIFRIEADIFLRKCICFLLKKIKKLKIYQISDNNKNVDSESALSLYSSTVKRLIGAVYAWIYQQFFDILNYYMLLPVYNVI